MLINMSDGRANNGGEREGAGRPKGSTRKPRLTDDLTKEQKEELVRKIYKKAMEGSDKLLQFLAEQIYGKAPQSVEMDAQGKFILEIAKQVADKNETYDITSHPSTSG